MLSIIYISEIWPFGGFGISDGTRNRIQIPEYVNLCLDGMGLY